MYDLIKISKSWLDTDLKGILCEKARGFTVVKLSVSSTHMSTLYNWVFEENWSSCERCKGTTSR
ncbi:hypothetical protein KY284_035870 [Solanum tuberosum]|nr:hypothetical protein KY284_035870 [Solanum tuberosum]